MIMPPDIGALVTPPAGGVALTPQGDADARCGPDSPTAPSCAESPEGRSVCLPRNGPARGSGRVATRRMDEYRPPGRDHVLRMDSLVTYTMTANETPRRYVQVRPIRRVFGRF